MSATSRAGRGIRVISGVVCLRFHPQRVERTRGAGDYVGGDSCVARRGIDTAVAEQHLNDACVGAVFKKMRGEGVAEGMGGDAFGEAALSGSVAARLDSDVGDRCLFSRQEGNIQSWGRAARQ